MPDGHQPTSGGWNGIQVIVSDIAAEVDCFRAAGLPLCNDIVRGPAPRKVCSTPVYVIRDA